MKQEPIIKETVTLANSEFRKIADRVVNTAILAAQKVSVENNLEPMKESFEAILKERLSSFNEKKIETIRKKMIPLYQASLDLRTELYGELGKIDLSKTKSVELEVGKLSPVKINRKVLGLWNPPAGSDLPDIEIKKRLDLQTEILSPHNITFIDAITGGGPVFDEIGGLDSDEPDLEDDNFEPQAVTDKLGLNIRRVKCINETNAGWTEWTGSDEIALAGISVDETGGTKKIGENYIGGGFDNGDSKGYNPAWQWNWFNMREGGNNWPKSYFLTFILVEKDDGGLSSFLQKLWDKVRQEVYSSIAKAVGESVDKKYKPLGSIIGPAVAYAVDKIVDWFIKAWQDDIFPPKTISCTVPAYGARWSRNNRWGYTTSSRRRVHFYGHSGHYYVEFYWRLFS